MLLRDAVLNEPVLGVGVMSGTSFDAVDVAVVSFEAGPVRKCRVVRYEEHPLSDGLRRRLLDAVAQGSTRELCLLNVELGRAFGLAIAKTVELALDPGVPQR